MVTTNQNTANDNSNRNAPVDPDKIWIYHERQESSLCGQHALNNLAQAPIFSYHQLASIAGRLDQLELQFLKPKPGSNDNKDYLARLAQGSENVDGAGNFSIQVLTAALEQEYGVTLPHLSQQDLLNDTDITDVQGFMCHKLNHWFAIRQVGGRFWNLDSMKELPIAVSHFKLATAMQTWAAEGYTIFCVKQGLPVGGVKLNASAASSNQNKGAGAGNWHKMANLLQGNHTAADPWQGVGSGMRLDGGNTSGKPAAATNTGATNNNGAGFMASASAAGMTEDEQLQMALQASMEPASAPAPTAAASAPMARVVSESLPPVPPEPKAGQPGTVRIQFRLPCLPKACVRRFDETDSVLCVYAYCQEKLANGNKPLQLKYGFPPQDLASQQDETIGSAGLGGQSLTGRYL
jgi:ataxin-3